MSISVVAGFWELGRRRGALCSRERVIWDAWVRWLSSEERVCCVICVPGVIYYLLDWILSRDRRILSVCLGILSSVSFSLSLHLSRVSEREFCPSKAQNGGSPISESSRLSSLQNGNSLTYLSVQSSEQTFSLISPSVGRDYDPTIHSNVQE